MISECLNDYHKPTELNTFFNQESPYKYPPIMICDDLMQKQQNDDNLFYNLDARDIQIGECMEVFNVRNLNDAGLLQAGYANNIDLDSELKRINHFDDKCFYDSYKEDPREAEKCTGLDKHKDTLIKDYTVVGKNYNPCNKNFDCKGNPNDRNRYNWCDHNYKVEKCANFQTFMKCNTPDVPSDYNYGKNYLNVREQILKKQDNLPDYYKFGNSDPNCNNYPCQRLFNNFTRRSTIPNFHNTTNINPKYLK